MKKALMLVAVAAIAAMLFAIPALAAKGKDANGDRIPDRWETRYHLSLNVNQAPKDQDKDGLRNLREYREGTSPRDADSDEDGTDDATECQGHRPPPPPDGGGEVPPEEGPVAP